MLLNYCSKNNTNLLTSEWAKWFTRNQSFSPGDSDEYDGTAKIVAEALGAGG